MTIYDVQNAAKLPIWQERVRECRTSGMGVKAWCKAQGLDFTSYYRWEKKVLESVIPTQKIPGSMWRIQSWRLPRNRILFRDDSQGYSTFSRSMTQLPKSPGMQALKPRYISEAPEYSFPVSSR